MQMAVMAEGPKRVLECGGANGAPARLDPASAEGTARPRGLKSKVGVSAVPVDYRLSSL